MLRAGDVRLVEGADVASIEHDEIAAREQILGVLDVDALERGARSHAGVSLGGSHSPARIGWQCRNSVIRQGASDGEMIERLKLRAADSEDLVQGVVEVATDAGAAESFGFGLQIENMPQKSGLPVQLAVAPGVGADDGFEFAEHAEREATVARNCLMAVHGPRNDAAIGSQQPDEGKMCRRAGRRLPLEIPAQLLAESVRRRRVARQRIDAGLKPFNPMDEEDGMDAWRKIPDVPRGIRPIEQGIQHAIEDICAHRGFAVEALRAAPAEDDFGGARLGRPMQGRMVREVGWRSGATTLCRLAHLPDHRPAIERTRIEQVRTSRPSISIAFPGAGNVALCRGDRRWSGFDRDQELGVFALPRPKRPQCGRGPSMPRVRRSPNPRPAWRAIPARPRHSGARRGHGRHRADNSGRRVRHTSRPRAIAPTKDRSKAGQVRRGCCCSGTAVRGHGRGSGNGAARRRCPAHCGRECRLQ